MTHDLTCDFETRSDVDLKTRGVWNYMASPHTLPLMASYKIDGGPTRRWRPGTPCPSDIVAHVAAGGMISAHNAAFERLLWQKVLTPRHGWPVARTEQFRCTAAVASALGLPRALDGLGDVLDLVVKKDKAGAALIRRFSLPRKPDKEIRLRDTEILALREAGADEGTIQHAWDRWQRRIEGGPMFNEPADFPAEFEAFHDYCDVDVETEAEADHRMVPLSTFEQSVYTLDQMVNDRGIRIDRTSALAALELAEKAKKLLDKEMADATGGAVRKCSEPAKLIEWVNQQMTGGTSRMLAEAGVDGPMASAAKADILDLLECDDLPPRVRRALELRQEAAKTSVSKLSAMLARADAESRVRHAFIYHKASTGRWQSVGVNFANLPRTRKAFEKAALDMSSLFGAFRTGEPELLPLLYGDDLGRPLHLISDALRGFLWAAPGHDFIQADYTSIEGAVIAWSSGEDWKVQAMHDIAADPSLPDLYRRAAAQIMNTTTEIVTKSHPLRQSVGKVSELALGFGGGVAAFHSMSLNYGVKLDPLFAPVWETASEERREKAIKRWEGAVKRGKEKADVLSREAWVACELIKVGWRANNPAIAAGWGAREAAVRDAIRNPGEVTKALKFSYVVKQGFLWCLLPSGRCLAYASPKLKDQVWVKVLLGPEEWSESEVMDRELAERLALKGDVKIEGKTSPAITALGVDKSGRRMQREHLYGGILAENDTQAVARDILVNGMFKAEAAGYPIVLHVYDEMVAEVPRGFGDLAEFEKLICELPEWAAGLPLTASGWRGKRYRKD